MQSYDEQNSCLFTSCWENLTLMGGYRRWWEDLIAGISKRKPSLTLNLTCLTCFHTSRQKTYLHRCTHMHRFEELQSNLTSVLHSGPLGNVPCRTQTYQAACFRHESTTNLGALAEVHPWSPPPFLVLLWSRHKNIIFCYIFGNLIVSFAKYVLVFYKAGAASCFF